MKKHKLLLFILLLWLGHASMAQSIPPKSFLVCGDSKVLVVDYSGSSDSTAKVVWQWDAHTALDLPEEYRLKKFNSMDDCKAIDKGKRILASSSSGAIAIIDIKLNKVLFYAAVPNAHSIELLPHDLVAAAASTTKEGNKIMLFNRNKSGEPLFSDSLYSAHGMVWDKDRNRLFALGFDVIREYKLLLKDKPQLQLFKEWTLPFKGGHDLQMAPKENSLFLTIENAGAWELELNSGTFGRIKNFSEAKIIKSVGQDRSGQFVFTIPEERWWTFHVKFSHPSREVSFPGLRVYKARWFYR